MSIVKFEDTNIGQIYVTQGGLVETFEGTFPWGYERVKLLRKDEKTHTFVFETPWGTELEVRGDYTLYSTPENTVRSEHKMIGNHIGASIQRIPFDEAIKQGICIVDIENNTSIINTVSCVSPTSTDDIRQMIVNYFNTPRKVTEAAKHFDLPYPRLRGYIESIKKSGVNGKIYHVIEAVADDGRKTVQLVKT